MTSSSDKFSQKVSEQVSKTTEIIARDHYGRLVAYLASVFRDITLAEEGLSDALIAALETWQLSGIPQNPEGWLLKVAKRKIIDIERRQKTRFRYAEEFLYLLEKSSTETMEDSLEISIPDERLKLLFVCSHPALDSGIHTPLMLQTVLGLDAKQIAGAFLISPSTMSQRLVRAKTKIRDAGIAFDLPDKSELKERLSAVLNAIYITFGTGWDTLGDNISDHQDLTTEAIYLAQLINKLIPNNPEALGLLSLMLFCEARVKARLIHNVYTPLKEQDITKWDIKKIEEADYLLNKASSYNLLGRFQLEAAIQSAHTQAKLTGTSLSSHIITLYKGLLSVYPSIGAYVSYAATLLNGCLPEEALICLESISKDKIKSNNLFSYQPYWAVLAEIHVKLKNRDMAVKAFDIAIGLSNKATIKRHLTNRKEDFLIQFS